jgi:hypothetical protein
MPKTEFFFSPPDYAVFEQGLANSAEYDGERQRVHNKLESLHELLYPEIRRRKWDLHPHWMKQWLISAYRISPATQRIDFMTLRYSKAETTIKLMKKTFIEDFGSFYANAMLAMRVDREGFAIELFISEKAWLDGQNFKARLAADAKERGALRSMLADLGGDYIVRLSMFERSEEVRWSYREVVRAKASRLVNVGMLNSTMEKYMPGRHDLRLGVYYEPNDKRLSVDNLADEILKRLEQLYPVYAFLSWSPKNDFRKTDANKKSSR